MNYTIIYKKLNIDNYIKKTTSDLKQQIRTLYICSKKKKKYIYIYIYSHYGDNREGTLYTLLCTMLAVHTVWALSGLGGEPHGRCSLMAYLLRSLIVVWALWWLHNAIQQCVTVHPVPKFRSCHKAIMVTTGRAHCIHYCIYIYIYRRGLKNLLKPFKP